MLSHGEREREILLHLYAVHIFHGMPSTNYNFKFTFYLNLLSFSVSCSNWIERTTFSIKSVVRLFFCYEYCLFGICYMKTYLIDLFKKSFVMCRVCSVFGVLSCSFLWMLKKAEAVEYYMLVKNSGSVLCSVDSA